MNNLVTRGLGKSKNFVTSGLGAQIISDIEETISSNGGSGRSKLLTNHRNFLTRKELDQLIEKRDVWQYATHQEKSEKQDLLLQLDADISEAAKNYIAARLTLLRLELEERRRMYVLNTLLLYLYV